MSTREKEKEKKKKPIDFQLTAQAVLIKLSRQADQIALLDSKMVSYEQQLRSMEPDYAYSVALSKIQVVLDGANGNLKRPISCKAGCSACCHQKVAVAPYEAQKIQEHLLATQHKFDADRLKKQATALATGTFQELTFAERECVFLDAEEKCSIYSVRPLMCRRHFVQSDPILCRKEDITQIELDVNADADAYLSAYVTRNPTRPLAEYINDWLNSQPDQPGKKAL